MSSSNNLSMSKRHYFVSLVMLGLLFFIFGLVSWVNSILVPYFKIACELQSEVQSYLANFAFYIAYLIMAFPASILLNRIGFKNGVKYGLWILALGALLFMPAAYTRTYNMFLLASSSWAPDWLCCKQPPIRSSPSSAPSKAQHAASVSWASATSLPVSSHRWCSHSSSSSRPTK